MKHNNLGKFSNSSESITSKKIDTVPILEESTSTKENMTSLFTSCQWQDNNISNSSSLSSNISNINNKANSSPTKSAATTKDPKTGSSTYVRGRPSACVFVASLRSNMSDDDLCVSVTNHFEKWGQLSTVKVLRDTSNRPYAFVQYENEQDSKNAIKYGHDSELDGRFIRCEAAKVNRTLFIRSKNNLSEILIETKLSSFGEIEELLPSNFSGQIYNDAPTLQGYKNWFCKFVYRDDAIKAYANLTEEGVYQVDWAQNVDKRRTIKYRREEDENSKAAFDKFSIFIGQLNSNITETELRERFERHGGIENLHLIKKPDNTFAFITFIDEASAARSVEVENHSMLCGKTMHVQYRELQSSYHSSRNFKVALAPPPINLGRRNSSNANSYKFNHKTSKPKFNNYSSNNYNRGGGKGGSGNNYKWKQNDQSSGFYDDKKLSTTNNYDWSASQLDLKNDEHQNLQSSTLKSDLELKRVYGDSNNENRKPTNNDVEYGASNKEQNPPNLNPPTTAGFPLFYYVPAENFNYQNVNSTHQTTSQPPFFNVYSQYYPPQISQQHQNPPQNNQVENSTVGGNNSNANLNVNDFTPFGAIHTSPSFAYPNFAYYTNENDESENDNQ
ncbi:hypothetical protein KGF54_001805 [Candida jiufengensis]|uniref:uncharacterized protein n=1 Tax=Candida jiufengensis TaxID=497108 RepID=UPI00222518A7|nr:uncharacterized protein KGF54_001805 [Candida jiufengensis]KAI5955244.1 hypothetical protein KGF54_001805 [Candida jiufengensis]